MSESFHRAVMELMAVAEQAAVERKHPSTPDFSAIPLPLLVLAEEAWEAGDIDRVLCLIENHQHFRFVMDNLVRLVARDLYENAFVTAYTSINFNMGSLPHWDDLLWMLKFANRKRLLHTGDPLPGTGPFTVYRGVGDGSRKRYAQGLSWTASPETALSFANLWAERCDDADPAVFEYTVKPEQVYFYTNERGEQEFVISVPRNAHLRRLPKLPKAGLSTSHIAEVIEGNGATSAPKKKSGDKCKKVKDSCEDPVSEKVIEYALSCSKCGSRSVHGLSHWQRVASNAEHLCRDTGADPKVVRLFAYLHDAWRLDDGKDPDHGKRAADGLKMIPDSMLEVEPNQITLLDYAIRHHVDGDISDDPTIGTCWDADRLDLGRVGIITDRKYMSTARGKELAGIRS